MNPRPLKSLLAHTVFLTAALACAPILAPTRAAQATEGALYRGVQTNQFMKRWLLLAPIAVFAGDAKADDQEAQKKAFASDLLADSGGEAAAQPRPGQTLKVTGTSLTWRLI